MYNNHALKMGVVLLWRKTMLKVVTLEAFKLYHQLLMQYIDGKDSQSVDIVEMTENLLGVSESDNDTNNEK